MSLLAYEDPGDTDEFGMKRNSVISTHSATMSTRDDSASEEVTELRAALATAQQATIAADNKAQVLESELTRFKEQHQFIAASKEAVQQQLREETTRREAAEEKVELLRGQVEQARRTVMQLQKQDNERAAIRAASGSVPQENTEEPSNVKKRQSLYGRGRPTSTMSVTSDAGGAGEAAPAVPATGLRELRLGGHARGQSMSLRVATDGSLKSPRTKSPRSPSAQQLPSATYKLRRASDEDGEPKEAKETDKESTSPPLGSLAVSTSTTAGEVSANSSFDAGAAVDAILQATQSELLSLRQQLESLSIQYAESEEARIASESCVNALREFIASEQHQETTEAISLPPLPTDKAADDMEDDKQQQQQQQGKWAFGGLWKTAAPAQPSSSASSVPPPIETSPNIAVTPPERSPKAASIASISSPPPASAHPIKVDEDTVLGAGGGLGRSLSSFFGRRRGSKASTNTTSTVTIPETSPGIDAGRELNAGLGLHLEEMPDLPPPPSVEASLATPGHLTDMPKLSPRPARSPARSIPPIAESSPSPTPTSAALSTSPVPPARSPARSPAPEAEETSPGADSPPPASITTTEHDDLPTPADSPIPDDDFAPSGADGEDTLTGTPKRPQRGAARRGTRARGRGKRGAA